MNPSEPLSVKVTRALRRMANSTLPQSAQPTRDPAKPPAPTRSAALLADLEANGPHRITPHHADLTVATALGDRLTMCLGWEWNQLALTPDTWRRVTADRRPDFVLLELAHGAVPGWSGAAVSDLIAWTRVEAVSAVVWVTAGGVEVPEVLVEDTDLLFVHDPAVLANWQDRWPGATIDVLAPAAQPRLHRPDLGGPGDRRDPRGVLITDAGGLAAPALESFGALVVPGIKPMKSDDFDVWTQDEHAAGQMAALKSKLVGRAGYPATAGLAGRYRVLLDAGRENAGSSWTLLEAGAAQTAVVTLPSHLAGLPVDIADHVVAGDDPKVLRGELVARIHQPELRDREALRLHRAVLAGHTYTHRVDRILEGIGRPVARRSRSVSAVAPTNREYEISNILENMARQAHSDLELVLVLHGLDVKHAEVEAQAAELGVNNLTVIDADQSLTLGACLNRGIDAASGAYIAKIDDDNFYGTHYLTDLVAAFDYTDAAIVGKWAHYVWLRSSEAVVLRYFESEHTYERRIQGGSMLIDGGLARSLRFSDIPRAVDSDFLDRAIADGVKIYSGDRFNFVSVRGTDRQAHTWKVGDVTFMTKTGRLVFFGDPRSHVEV